MGYNLDITAKHEKARDTRSHHMDAMLHLDDVVKVYRISISCLKTDSFSVSSERYSMLGSNVVKEQLLLLLKFQRDMFNQLLKI